MLVQGRTGRHRLAEIVRSDPQALARSLDEALVWGAIRAQEDRDACQALPPDDPRLNATTMRRNRHYGGDALFQKVDVLNGRVRLDQTGPHGQRHTLKLRLKNAEVLNRKGQQQAIADRLVSSSSGAAFCTTCSITSS